MRRTVLIVAFLTLFAVLAVPAMGLAPATDGAAQVEDGEAAPGEQLAGVVGVQGAELDGELDQRAFGIQFAQAADNETRADVVADRIGSVDDRLDELQERKETLEERYEAGEIPEGKYRAEMAKVAAEIQMLSQATNQTERAAGSVPAGLLEERGVDADAIQRLKQKASDLSGPEVAEIARGIAGPGVGEPRGGPGNATGPPVNATGPPGEADDNPASDRSGSTQSAGPADDADGDNQSAGPDDNPGNESAGGSDDTPADDSAGGPDDQPGSDTGGSDNGSQSADESDEDESED